MNPENQPPTTAAITLEDLAAKLDELKALTAIGVKKVLTMKEAALYTGWSLPRMYAMTSGRLIPYYKKNSKVYFNKEELDAWMLQRKMRTKDELEADAENYCFNRGRVF